MVRSPQEPVTRTGRQPLAWGAASSGVVGVGSFGGGLVAAHSHVPPSVAIASFALSAIAIVACSVVTIIKIRAPNGRRTVGARSGAALAKRVRDPKQAMLLDTYHELATEKKAASASLESCAKLLEQTTGTPDEPSAASATAPGDRPDTSEIPSNEQLQKMVGQLKSDGDGLRRRCTRQRRSRSSSAWRKTTLIPERSRVPARDQPRRDGLLRLADSDGSLCEAERVGTLRMLGTSVTLVWR